MFCDDKYIIEISRMTCTTLAKLQKDVVVCFDRQVNSYAKLSSTKYEGTLEIVYLDRANTIISGIFSKSYNFINVINAKVLVELE